MTLIGSVCLLTLGLAIGAGPQQGFASADRRASAMANMAWQVRVASAHALLRDLPIAAPIIWPLMERLDDAVVPDRLAPNIWMQQELRAALQDVMAQSATFRQIVAAIDRQPRVHVGISIAPNVARQCLCRAQCEMKLYDSGLLTAHIKLADTNDVAELAAHELEHVREWLDGVNLRQAYHQQRPGVWRMGDGRFESQRAIEMGERVKAEVKHARRELTRLATPDGALASAQRAAPAVGASRRPTP